MNVDDVTDQKASCAPSLVTKLFRQNGLDITNDKSKADYILSTKTRLYDAGGGFVGIRLERKILNVKTGKQILIPQEAAMPQHHFTKHGINCKSAAYTALPEIKEFIK